jgi:hypothetical protein
MPRHDNLPEVIRDRDGNPIHRSRNLAGIRRYVGGRHAPIIRNLLVHAIGTSAGKLMILFEDGSSYETVFNDYGRLLSFVKNWRNVHGSPFLVNGVDAGTVHRNHPAFANAR